ncbi:type 1 glutamine amidotransferase, partial [Halomonas sp. SIMBA_159]
LDAVVAPSIYPEAGWYQVTLAPERSFALLEQFEAFMWHRLVFSLSDNALTLGGRAAAPLQGFSWESGRVVGLLCHL